MILSLQVKVISTVSITVCGLNGHIFVFSDSVWIPFFYDCQNFEVVLCYGSVDTMVIVQ
jgi:hypothetical protein